MEEQDKPKARITHDSAPYIGQSCLVCHARITEETKTNPDEQCVMIDVAFNEFQAVLHSECAAMLSEVLAHSINETIKAVGPEKFLARFERMHPELKEPKA